MGKITIFSRPLSRHKPPRGTSCDDNLAPTSWFCTYAERLNIERGFTNDILPLSGARVSSFPEVDASGSYIRALQSVATKARAA